MNDFSQDCEKYKRAEWRWKSFSDQGKMEEKVSIPERFSGSSLDVIIIYFCTIFVAYTLRMFVGSVCR